MFARLRSTIARAVALASLAATVAPAAAVEKPASLEDHAVVAATPESPELSPESLELQETKALESRVFAAGQLQRSNVARARLMLDNFDVPVVYNEHVSEMTAFFQGAARSFYSKSLARSSRFVPLLRDILEQYRAPTDLVYLAMIESGFMTGAYSKAHAAGPWQFTPETAGKWGLRVSFWVDERCDFVKATHAAARYLEHLHSLWNDWYLAWASYNAGPQRVARAIEKANSKDYWELVRKDALPEETKHYVPMIIAAGVIAKNAKAFGFDGVGYQPQVDYEVVRIVGQVELEEVARAAGVGVEAIRELNPEILRVVTPPVAGDEPYLLRLPKGARRAFETAFHAPTAPRRYRGYRVQYGDTVRKIAERFDADALDLVRLNRLQDRPIRVGQELVIPPARSGSTAPAVAREAGAP